MMDPFEDYAHQETEKKLAELEAKIAAIYQQAAEDLQAEIETYFVGFAEKDAQQKKKVETGEITQEEYIQWRLGQMTRSERFFALRDEMAERFTRANEVAVAYVNDETPGIYSLNRNYAAYTMEQSYGDIFGFTLFNEQAVRRLIVETPNLLPNYPLKKAIQRGLDLRWGKQKINAIVTSSILRGQSILEITKDLKSTFTSMERSSAIRIARTAMTSAQNGGRYDSYTAAAKMGINMRKRWVVTKDSRTRHSHRKLDRETVECDKAFSNGCRYPGDPHGKPEEVYNCRCTMRTVDPLAKTPKNMRVRDPVTGKNVVVNEMTYQEWEKWVKGRETVKENKQ